MSFDTNTNYKFSFDKMSFDTNTLYFKIHINNYYQNNVPGFHSISKPSPAAPDYDEFLLEYISSGTMDRLDILACNSEIDGFIIFFDNQTSVMSHFE